MPETAEETAERLTDDSMRADGPYDHAVGLLAGVVCTLPDGARNAGLAAKERRSEMEPFHPLLNAVSGYPAESRIFL